MDARRATQMLSVEGLHGDIVWWTRALDLVAEIRDGPLPDGAFQDAVSEIIPSAEELDVGTLLKTDLSLPQKLFLLAILDAFLDVSICSSDVPTDRRLENWESAAEFLIPAGLAVLEDPSHIQAEKVEEMWQILVAAAS